MTVGRSSKEPYQSVRKETGDLHSEVETLLSDRFFQSDALNKEQFLSLLKAFYRIYSPLEENLIPAIETHMSGYDYECRTTRLEKDFTELGLATDAFQGFTVLPSSLLQEPSNYSELLGILYVIKGSEMGNHVMQSHLEEILPNDCLDADNFFRERCDKYTREWQQFKNRLNRDITTEDELESLIESARTTFGYFKRSFEWTPENL